MQITKVLISLRICCSQPPEDRFTRFEAHYNVIKIRLNTVITDVFDTLLQIDLFIANICVTVSTVMKS